MLVRRLVDLKLSYWASTRAKSHSLGSLTTLRYPRYEPARTHHSHCERSEAIHTTTKKSVDCFAPLAMTAPRVVRGES